MNKTNKYSPEVRERAVRLVQEHRGEYPSLWVAVESIAPKIGRAGWYRKSTARDQSALRIAYPRHCAESTALWVSTHPRTASSRRLAGQPEAGAPTLQTRGATSAHARAPEQAKESTPGPGTASYSTRTALEHGFRA